METPPSEESPRAPSPGLEPRSPAAAVARCAACGARQPDAGSAACVECGQPLVLAEPPVARGPAGWCGRHPDRETTGVCAACGDFTCTACEVSVGGVRYCDRCRQQMPRAFTAPVAWESRRQIGRLRAWVRTVTLVTGQPGRFFERMPPRSGLGAALLFALSGAALHQLGGIGWTLVQDAAALVGAFGAGIATQDASELLPMLRLTAARIALDAISPPLVVLLYLAVAALQHGALRIVDAGGEHGITATLKVACYAFGIGWLGILPVIGPLLFPLWWTALMVVGCARVHRRSTLRTVVVILPTCLLCGAPVAAFFAAGVLSLLVGF